MHQVLQTTIRYGLILLLIWTPLAFGSVHPWAFSLLEIHVFLLVAAWMVQIIVSRRRSVPERRVLTSFVRTPLFLPLMSFIALLLFQLIPLPPVILKQLSPTTYELYSLTLPGWPGTQPMLSTQQNLLAISRPLSLSPYATRLELSKFLAYSGLFFLIVNTLRTRRRIRAVYLVIVWLAAAMALFGIVQKLSGTSAIYWVRDTSYVSFFGPYINHNHFAGYQAMAILLGLGVLFARPADAHSDVLYTWRQRLLWWFGLLARGRGPLVYALAVMTGALFFSLSRGGVLSFLLGLVLLSVLLLTCHRGADRRAVWIITLAAMAGMLLWLGITPLLARFEGITYGEDALTWAGRLPVFQATWKMSKDFPLFGVGYEAFPVIFPRYQLAAPIQLHFPQAHNDFLQLLAETGWVGFVLLVGGVLRLVADIVRRWRAQHDPFVQAMIAAGVAALSAMAIHSLVDFNLHIPANALLFTTTLALTYACANLPHGRSVRRAA